MSHINEKSFPYNFSSFCHFSFSNSFKTHFTLVSVFKRNCSLRSSVCMGLGLWWLFNPYVRKIVTGGKNELFNVPRWTCWWDKLTFTGTARDCLQWAGPLFWECSSEKHFATDSQWITWWEMCCWNQWV